MTTMMMMTSYDDDDDDDDDDDSWWHYCDTFTKHSKVIIRRLSVERKASYRSCIRHW